MAVMTDHSGVHQSVGAQAKDSAHEKSGSFEPLFLALWLVFTGRGAAAHRILDRSPTPGRMTCSAERNRTDRRRPTRRNPNTPERNHHTRSRSNNSGNDNRNNT